LVGYSPQDTLLAYYEHSFYTYQERNETMPLDRRQKFQKISDSENTSVSNNGAQNSRGVLSGPALGIGRGCDGLEPMPVGGPKKI